LLWIKYVSIKKNKNRGKARRTHTYDWVKIFYLNYKNFQYNLLVYLEWLFIYCV